MKISRSVYGYRSKARDAAPLIMRIKEITATRVHYGYRRVHVLLRRGGWKDNHKRVYRFYRQLGLSLRHRRPKRNKAVYLRQDPLHVNLEHPLRHRSTIQVRTDHQKHAENGLRIEPAPLLLALFMA